MAQRDVRDRVSAILGEFSHRTGLVGELNPPRRYLWTDAFAVCTFLALHRATAAREPYASALALVEQVHGTLGRHRLDERRRGWISGLSEAEGRDHPTFGGLRIGKRLPERGAAEPVDERLEWDRDGQYFHYLTKWMHALSRVARASADGRYLQWAIELARAAHAGFVRTPRTGAPGRMLWKASIDLSRPQVASMGAHDPLDGLLTFRALRAEARRSGWSAEDAGLDGPIADLRALCAGLDWGTTDPLGIGGLLGDAWRLAQLAEAEREDVEILPALVEDAAAGLAAFVHSGALRVPAEQRLAFRELGLSIGLHAVPRLARLLERSNAFDAQRVALQRGLAALRPFLPLAEAIETFWSDPANQRAESWRAHLDIDAVMLATSLMPEGYLEP